MAKKKIVKLTDEQYIKYITSLKNDPALYGADGEMTVPDSIKPADNRNTNRRGEDRKSTRLNSSHMA